MPASVKACERQLRLLEAARAKHRKALAKLNAKHRVWGERLRSAMRKDMIVK